MAQCPSTTAPGPIWRPADVRHKDLDDAVMHARRLRELAEASSEFFLLSFPVLIHLCLGGPRPLALVRECNVPRRCGATLCIFGKLNIPNCSDLLSMTLDATGADRSVAFSHPHR